MKYEKIAVIIPTFNPTDKLISVVNNLKKIGLTHVFVVDDGSLDKSIFSKIDVSKILTHDVNMGKGMALKTGFKYIIDNNYDGVLTVDDDLQQNISDIKKIVSAFLEKSGIYLGVRTFDKAPLIRKMGNKLSAIIFKAIYKKSVVDTQTGLRCFPNNVLSDLINIKGKRFEYEMNQLKYFSNKNYDINQIPIKTIYNDSKSHYKALIDSYRILKVMIDKNNY